MDAKSLDRHIVMTPGTCGGRPRIAGRRITVENVAYWHDRMGWSATRIADEYGLDPASVFAALAYYHDHRDDIDRRSAEDEAFAEELRKKTPSLLQKYRERLGDGKAG